MGHCAAGAGYVVTITAVDGRDAVAATRECRGCERGGVTAAAEADGASPQGGGAVHEGHTTGSVARHSGGEGNRVTIPASAGRASQTGGEVRLVHRLADGVAGATGVVTITAIHGRDAVAAGGQGRGTERGAAASDRSGTQ